MFRGLALSSRPLSWVNTAFPFAAAYLLSAGVDATLVIGTLYFLIPYNLAMYGINDVFDYESDLRNPRKGGVEGAMLDRRMHRPILIAAAVTNVPLGPLFPRGLFVVQDGDNKPKNQNFKLYRWEDIAGDTLMVDRSN